MPQGTVTSIKQPGDLSQRIKSLRDYYFQGTERPWNNEHTAWTTGTDWDIVYNELSYYIVPETYMLVEPLRSSYKMSARKIPLHPEFWNWGIAERRAWFLKEVMVQYLPREILPGDLLAGGRFNVQTSLCLSKKEAEKWDRKIYGKNGLRAKTIWFHNHGYGNTGATSGHLIPDYPRVLQKGFKDIFGELKQLYEGLPPEKAAGAEGSQLRGMMTAAQLPKELAHQYSSVCSSRAESEKSPERRDELRMMAEALKKVPWEPADTFWEAMQSLWLTHMLVMSDENYPGPGVSFGRIDQYLAPFWQKSLEEGMEREFGKEIMKCFWFHANTAYDAMIRNGNQGITAGFGQLLTLSGMGPSGNDLTNSLTYAMLEVIDEMSPILEPKPNVRLHRKTPDALLDKIVGMIADSQGAPFLLNFDERSMAGMMREARRAGITDHINENTVWDYAPVGCLENTMQGNDRSGTVDNNINLLKAVELALNNGRDMHPYHDTLQNKTEKIKRDGPATGNPASFAAWEDFFDAYAVQTRYIIRKTVELYEESEELRAKYFRTPYLSCLVGGCARKALDVTEGGAEIGFTTMEAVTFATTVDSLLAVKYLVYDEKKCSMNELVQALLDNWKGHEKLQAIAKYKAPKYGKDDDKADAVAKAVMDLWTGETWKYTTKSTGRRFRPGMLSWNYWAGDGFILPASPDGRPKGQFLSNAICPSNGADSNGPTSNTNSVGKVLGGKAAEGESGDWGGFLNSLPNGASHTITFDPSMVRDPEHREKFKAYLRGYIENGGTALQVNMVSADTLRDAQNHPQDYTHLLVRVTGYNAYFTTVGKELQDEIINRTNHSKW